MVTFIPQARATANTASPAPPPVVKSGDFSELKHTGSGRVASVIDAYTVLLKDGKIVRLSGIEYPSPPGNGIADEILTAKDRLAKILPENTEIMLYQSRNTNTGRTNRMGHHMAHLVSKKDEGWINGTLIAEGYAWAMTDKDVAELAPQLYALEEKAREAKMGLWSDKSAYPLLTPDTAGNGNGTFRVVEGPVIKIAAINNNLYLNFGKDYRKDFTVMITPAVRKAMSRRGVDPMGFAGKNVRVRGWIREWNGPFMELDTPERIEIAPSAPQQPEEETVQISPPDSALPVVRIPAPSGRTSGQVNP